MIILFESDPKVIQRSSFHQQISPIPFVGDPDKVRYKQWGVESSMMKMMKTFFSAANRQAIEESQQLDLPIEKDKEATMSHILADFLIDERGIIQHVHYGKDMNDHIDLQEIRDFVYMPTSATA